MHDDDPDVAHLLAAALDDEPRPGFTRRVMERLAGARTVVELARLIGVAPVSGWGPREATADPPATDPMLDPAPDEDLDDDP